MTKCKTMEQNLQKSDSIKPLYILIVQSLQISTLRWVGDNVHIGTIRTILKLIGGIDLVLGK